MNRLEGFFSVCPCEKLHVHTDGFDRRRVEEKKKQKTRPVPVNRREKSAPSYIYLSPVLMFSVCESDREEMPL